MVVARNGDVPTPTAPFEGCRLSLHIWLADIRLMSLDICEVEHIGMLDCGRMRDVWLPFDIESAAL